MQDFRYFIEVGASVPIEKGGAAAKIILSHAEEKGTTYEGIRLKGYYISRGQRHRHFASISVPLFESDGKFLGLVTITGMAIDLTDQDLESFIPIIRNEVAIAGFSIS